MLGTWADTEFLMGAHGWWGGGYPDQEGATFGGKIYHVGAKYTIAGPRYSHPGGGGGHISRSSIDLSEKGAVLGQFRGHRVSIVRKTSVPCPLDPPMPWHVDGTLAI